MKKRAIIVAAGRGTRMASYSNAAPKSLLTFKGEPLLRRQLRSMHEAGIREFVVVGGYMFDKMQEFVRTLPYDVTLVYNPFFAEMNSVGSLWFARAFLDRDVFITNGDTFFSPPVYAKLERAAGKFVFGVDASSKNDADYHVTIANDHIVDMGKDIPDEETMAEYVGMALIRGKGIRLFRQVLEDIVRVGNYRLWWEDMFMELMARGERISYADVTGELWFEVDEIKDFRKYQRCF